MADRLLWQMLGAVVGTYLWTRYFRQSRRVLATYGPDAVRRPASARTLLLASAGAACLVIAPAVVLRAFWPSTDGPWLVYAAAEGGFRVEMPGTPAVTREPFQEPDGTVSIFNDASVETWDGAAFSVSYSDLPQDADLSDPDAILDAMCDGAVDTGVLQHSREIALREFPGRDFLARSADGRFSMTGRVFLVDRRSYTLFAVTFGERSQEHIDACDRFLNSFILTER